MKITPNYIRRLQEENKINISEAVDDIMEGCVNNLVCTGKVYVSPSNIHSHGITYESFRDELLSRGFYVDSRRYKEGSCAVVSLPPDDENAPPEPPPIRKVHSWG